MAMTRKNLQKFVRENGGADNFLHNGPRQTSSIRMAFEFASLSDSAILAAGLGVARKGIDAILGECREPEGIDDRLDGAPSKRLKALSPTFKKTVTGRGIAKAVGIDAMRCTCPLFDAWVTSLQGLAGGAR